MTDIAIRVQVASEDAEEAFSIIEDALADAGLIAAVSK